MKIDILNGKMVVISSYNSDFVAAARKLGGKFSGDAWVFDAANEKQVRDALYLCYGEDGKRVNQCDVEITINGTYSVERAPIEFFGRTVARAFGRDSGVKYGDDAAIVNGEFRSGGSRSSWRTVCEDGAVIIMRNVSRRLVDEWQDTDKVSVKILPKETNSVDDLLAEKAELEARIAEIAAALKDLGYEG